MSKLSVPVYSKLAESIPDNKWERAFMDWYYSLKRDNTRQSYLSTWHRFTEVIQGRPLDTLVSSDFLLYRESLVKQGLSSATVNLRLAALRSFMKYAIEKGLLVENPTLGVETLTVEKYGKARFLKDGEHMILLNSIPQTDPLGARDYAIMLMLLSTGVRASVPANLTYGDLQQVGNRVIMTYEYKGGKTKTLELPHEVVTAISVYQKYRVIIVDKGTSVFVTKSGKPMTRIDVTQMVARRTKAAGLGELRAHTMRHTATRLAEQQRYTISQLKDFTGHSDVKTLLIYLDSVTDAAGGIAASLAGSMTSDSTFRKT